MNAPDEREIRSKYLGSSDACAVLGLSKWKTPLDVYRAKNDPFSIDEPDADKRKLFKRGKLLEPVIRELATDEYDLRVVAVNERYADPEYPWMRAEIDFEILGDDLAYGGVVNCEAKSVGPFAANEWGEADTDEIPIEYYAQVLYGLMVTGRCRCYVFALFGSDNLVRYIVDRDDETIADMRATMVRFWTERVIAGVPPEPLRIEDAVYLFQRVRGRRVEATPEAAAAAERYRLLGHEIKSLEEAREEAKFEAVTFLLAACAAATGNPDPDEDAEMVDPDSGRVIATYKKQRHAHLDQRRLKEEHPALHATLMIEQDIRVLRPKDPNALPKRKSR